MRVRGSMVLALMAVAATSLLAGCSRIGGTHASAARSSSVAWERDLAAGLSRAGSEGKKVVMVDFYTDWCGWCRKLDETTFSDPAVSTTLKRLVSVKLDAERGGRADAERFNVEGFPTLLFLDAKGTEVARIPGYLPPGEFLEQLNEILKKA
jgi:thiol:disulfide interchange protein